VLVHFLAAERDAQRPPPTATTAEVTDCKITPRRENGKRGGGSLEEKLGAVSIMVSTVSKPTNPGFV